MKKVTIALIAVLFASVSPAKAQGVDEIINNYFEITGGMEAWKNLNGIKINAKVNQGGIEIPIEIVQLRDGRQYTKITIQGLDLMQGVFDGTNLWSTNFATMKAEKADDESTSNAKLDANDFPNSFFDHSFLGYKEKGYKIELMGKETFDGAETYKIKLVREPRIVDGKSVEDVQYFYFEDEYFVPIGLESEIKEGPAKGQLSQTKLSDYIEVSGLYFPYSITQGIKGGQSQPVIIDNIELNPAFVDSDFSFPNN
ncbi:MAG: outer membrane lipoprotein-sorting protein [Cyclobacteriaceae bacterium]